MLLQKIIKRQLRTVAQNPCNQWHSRVGGLRHTHTLPLTIAQIPLGSSRHVMRPLDTFDMSSKSRRACRAVLFQHGGRWTNY